jgi:hypothetical protein
MARMRKSDAVDNMADRLKHKRKFRHSITLQNVINILQFGMICYLFLNFIYK